MLSRSLHALLRYRSIRFYTEVNRKVAGNALLSFIKDKIRTSGPITVHEYMQLVVGSQIGYYAQQKKIFGSDGDFITSPELSQMFGEIIAVWCLNEIKNTGHRGEWQLVELGPGTGKLMSDLLRVFNRFKETNMSVHLVDISEALINEQEQLLCGNVSMAVTDQPWIRRNKTIDGWPIYWYRALSDVPEQFSVFVANEFLDALPIHQFKRDSKGVWHEVYLNLNDMNNLCFMLSKNENLHTKGLIPEHIRKDSSKNECEVCPQAGHVITEVCERIRSEGGFGLFIDYGHDGSRPNFSLRAYKNMAQVNPLEEPSVCDITSDVNFGYLKSLIEDRALVFGPIEQRRFLDELGISIRIKYLLHQCKTDGERESLLNGFKMLMSTGDGMGDAFKVMSIFPAALKIIIDKRGGAPPGFLSLINR